VFSVGSAPRLYNEDTRRADDELRDSPDLAVGRLIEELKRDGNEIVGSCGRELDWEFWRR
jgi:hypothetical protein